MKRNKIGCLATTLIAGAAMLWFVDLFFGGIFFPLPYRSLAPFYGKVIDADTKAPISDAVVLAVYSTTAYTPAGEVGDIVDGQETLTDENGEFRLPRKRRWFVLRRGYPKGEVEIFKPGYGFFPGHKQSDAIGENKSWPTPNKYIVYKIPKLTTKGQMLSNRPRSYHQIPYENRKLLEDAISRERANLGLSP